MSVAALSRPSIFFEVLPKTIRSDRPGPRHDRPATAAPPSTNSNSSRAIVTGMWQDAPAGESDIGRARHTVAPESNMLDWLTWPADQLLRIGGVVAGWFFSKDATSFTVVQMMFATLVLAAFVALLVFWQRLVEYCRSLWKTR